MLYERFTRTNIDNVIKNKWIISYKTAAVATAAVAAATATTPPTTTITVAPISNCIEIITSEYNIAV